MIIWFIVMVLFSVFKPSPKTEKGVLQVIAIGLMHRKSSHFDPMAQQLLREGIHVQFFQGVNGKTVDINRIQMSARYRRFFDMRIADHNGSVRDYRGHLGCTLSHLAVLKSITSPLTVVLEDDVCPSENISPKITELIKAATRVEKDWELLLLGFSCDYKDHHFNRLNDVEPVYEGGVVRLHHWIGQWAYVVRDPTTAQRLFALLNPIPWHIDLALANLARTGRVMVLGAVPPLVNHPGHLRLSSFDTDQHGDPRRIKSDTHARV